MQGRARDYRTKPAPAGVLYDDGNFIVFVINSALCLDDDPWNVRQKSKRRHYGGGCSATMGNMFGARNFGRRWLSRKEVPHVAYFMNLTVFYIRNTVCSNLDCDLKWQCMLGWKCEVSKKFLIFILIASCIVKLYCVIFYLIIKYMFPMVLYIFPEQSISYWIFKSYQIQKLLRDLTKAL